VASSAPDELKVQPMRLLALTTLRLNLSEPSARFSSDKMSSPLQMKIAPSLWRIATSIGLRTPALVGPMTVGVADIMSSTSRF
jgi:hypothetical protein